MIIFRAIRAVLRCLIAFTAGIKETTEKINKEIADAENNVEHSS